jgi:hypothetical protein
VPEDAHAIVEAAGECSNTEDYDRLDHLVSPDMTNHAAGPHGRKGWKQVWRAIPACLAGARADPLDPGSRRPRHGAYDQPRHPP